MNDIRFINISTKKYPNQWAVVDVWNFSWLNQWKWFSKIVNGKATCIVRSMCLLDFKKYKTKTKRGDIKMHRVIKNVIENPDVILDHNNRLPYDNREINIRECNKFENGRNSGLRRSNVLGFKGLSLDKRNGSWGCIIKINGRQLCISGFKTALEAAIIYDKLALKFHGEFACTNFQLGLYTKEQLNTITPKLPKFENSSAKCKGVHKFNHKKPWRATIGYKGKYKYLGCYNTREQAMQAYDEKLIEYFRLGNREPVTNKLLIELGLICL